MEINFPLIIINNIVKTAGKTAKLMSLNESNLAMNTRLIELYATYRLTMDSASTSASLVSGIRRTSRVIHKKVVATTNAKK